MSTETVTMTTEEHNPSLEEQAVAMGLDPETGEPTDQPEGDSDRPEWLPEKFSSPEEMAKAYAQLEQKLGGAEQPSEASAEEYETMEEVANEQLSEAGLDFDAFSEEYRQNGELSDDAYQTLEDAGIPRAIVDQFIQASEAQGEYTRMQILSEFGGEEQYGDMVNWASQNWSEEQIQTYDRIMNSGDLDMIRMAVNGLQSQYGMNSEPTRTVGGQTSSNSGAVYRSVSEMMADMQDPRYQDDPAFRKDVEAKLARSDIM